MSEGQDGDGPTALDVFEEAIRPDDGEAETEAEAEESDQGPTAWEVIDQAAKRDQNQETESSQDGPVDDHWTVQETTRAAQEREAVDTEALRRTFHQDLERAGVDGTTRPATTKLTHDQADLLVDLLEGFSDRRELLEWHQEVVVQSLGQLPDSWYTETATDAPTVSALLGRPWGPVDDVDPSVAREIRRGMVASDLLPAFRDAHHEFRWAAVERVEHLDDQAEGDAPDAVDPRLQEYPAMRPAFGELEGQQRAVLQSLLDGFDSAEQLLLWTVQVVGGTYAEIPAETVRRPYFEEPLRHHMETPTDGRDRFVRRSWAAEYLLPAFNRAAAELAQRAAEVTARETGSSRTGAGSIS